jgi:hypothetical protein
LKSLREQLKDINSQIHRYRTGLDSKGKSYPFTGIAFVIFNKQNDATRVINFFQLSVLYRIYSYVAFKIFKCKQQRVGSTFLDENRVIAHRAPEPTEIFWENLNVKTYIKFRYSVYVYLATLVVLLLAF